MPSTPPPPRHSIPTSCATISTSAACSQTVKINLVYSHYDRLILGSAVPAGKTLMLDKIEATGTATILERREMGVLNIGGHGHCVGRR